MSVTTYTLTVIGLYLKQAHRRPTVAVPYLELHPDYGIAGQCYDPPPRSSSGEPEPNLRQFTAVSPFELHEIATRLQVPFLDPAWLSANICFAGLDRLTETLVTGTRLLDTEGQALLEVKGETTPCLEMGQRLASLHPLHNVQPELFPRYAVHLRGVHGIALKPAIIRLYDQLTVIPPGD